MRHVVCLVPLILFGVSTLCGAETGPLDFNRDVRPILSNHCWNCHGPAEASREADLRLDQRDSATAPYPNRKRAIVPGDPASSELLVRIHATDDTQMPPREFEKPLSSRQKEILKQWIAEGAPYAAHWAFTPAERPSLPKVKHSKWPATRSTFSF